MSLNKKIEEIAKEKAEEVAKAIVEEKLKELGGGEPFAEVVSTDGAKTTVKDSKGGTKEIINVSGRFVKKGEPMILGGDIFGF